jgi:hypothetical protein
MATAKKAKKPSRASLMRQYYNGNPDATVKEVAKKFNTSYQVAYMAKRGIPHASNTTRMKLLSVFTNNRPILNPEITIEEPQSVLDTINPECVKSDPVNHPAHYKVGGIETIDFIEAKKLNYNLGNAVKYVTRADHKGNRREDLEKARWYINREIEQCN